MDIQYKPILEGSLNSRLVHIVWKIFCPIVNLRSNQKNLTGSNEFFLWFCLFRTILKYTSSLKLALQLPKSWAKFAQNLLLPSLNFLLFIHFKLFVIFTVSLIWLLIRVSFGMQSIRQIILNSLSLPWFWYTLIWTEII